MMYLTWRWRQAEWLVVSGLLLALAACGGGEKIPDLVTPSGTPGSGPVAAVCTDPSPASASGLVFAPAAGASGPKLSANAASVCFDQAVVTAVRSTTAMAQGAGSIHYFEATRTGAAAIGIGTAAAPVIGDPATGDMPANTLSLIAQNACVSRGGDVVGHCGLVRDETVLGFAVDYRGPYPIMYVFGRKANAGVSPAGCSGIADTEPCVLDRYELTGVTDPVHIYAFGSAAFGPSKVSINAGADLVGNRHVYSQAALRRALRARWHRSDRPFNPQWFGPGMRSLPVVSRGSNTPEATVIRLGDASPYRSALTASAVDAVDGDLTAAIRWLSPAGAELGTSGTLSLVGNPAITALGAGTHRLEAIATNRFGLAGVIAFTLTIEDAAGNVDTDGDGLTYDAEKTSGTDPAAADTDGDGLSDGVEIGLGFDPARADTDGNGVNDGRQYAADAALPERVALRIEAATSRGVLLTDDGLGAVLTSDVNPLCASLGFTDEDCRKRAVRADSPVRRGEFRYFETFRLLPNVGTTGPNMGQGVISGSTQQINPFCCLAVAQTPDARTPPALSVNSAASIWNTLVSVGNYDVEHTFYVGFAVDYRAAEPKVYVVTTDPGSGTGMAVSDAFTVTGLGGEPIYPFLYGHPQLDWQAALEINFGLKRFHYSTSSVAAALVSKGVDTTLFRPGIGIHKRPVSP